MAGSQERFVPRSSTIGDATAPPGRTAFVLPGIFASGRNWRTFALRLAATCPAWRWVIVDQRGHGLSRGAPPPHTLRACADDLLALSEELGGIPATVLGHSFGGKVAATLAEGKPAGLGQAWLLDAPLGAGPAGRAPDDSEVTKMIRALERIPTPIERRSDVVAHLAREGLPEPVAAWMAVNLEPAAGGGHVWSFDRAVIEELLADYWRADLWPPVANGGAGVDFQVVRGGRSTRWNRAELDRLEELQAKGRATVHTLGGAGHWLHADDPEGLLGVLAPHFGAG